MIIVCVSLIKMAVRKRKDRQQSHVLSKWLS